MTGRRTQTIQLVSFGLAVGLVLHQPNYASKYIARLQGGSAIRCAPSSETIYDFRYDDCRRRRITAPAPHDKTVASREEWNQKPSTCHWLRRSRCPSFASWAGPDSPWIATDTIGPPQRSKSI